MTLIECFTQSHLENIAACLRLRPDRLILVGDITRMHAPVKGYRKLLQQRGLPTEISLCNVEGMDFDALCGVLGGLMTKEKPCIIDLTGGDAVVVMAMGAALARLDSKDRAQVRVEKCACDGVRLTVEELVSLHGGRLLPADYQPPRDHTPRDLEGLWSVVSQDPKAWNRNVMLLHEFESRADSGTQVNLPLDAAGSRIAGFEEKEPVVRDLLDKLHSQGVIDDRSSLRALQYTYRSPLLRYCMLKAGNALEVKTLLEARAVLEDGAPFFNDCLMSVRIDWDGVIHDPRKRIPETRNEIDVILMHGLTPLFVSCKNGDIGEEELYKLHTVAERFGGPHARKMLIATELHRKSPAANRSFIQRAWDMDIFLVTDGADLSRQEWRQIFIQAVQ